MVVDRSKSLVVELLVESAALKAVGVDPHADAAALDRHSLGAAHQLRADALESQRFRHRQQLHIEPVVHRPAPQAADGLALRVAQQQRQRPVVGRPGPALIVGLEHGEDGVPVGDGRLLDGHDLVMHGQSLWPRLPGLESAINGSRKIACERACAGRARACTVNNAVRWCYCRLSATKRSSPSELATSNNADLRPSFLRASTRFCTASALATGSCATSTMTSPALNRLSAAAEPGSTAVITTPLTLSLIL